MKLAHQIGFPAVDQRIEQLLERFTSAFPGRIRSVYLVGSMADGTAVEASDIDLRMVFWGAFLPGEMEQFLALRSAIRAESPIEIDLPPLSEERLQQDESWAHEAIAIKAAGVLLWGEDLRAELGFPPLPVYLRDVTGAPLLFMQQLHNRPVSIPMDFPDPAGEFLGYDRPDPLDPGKRSLKLLVHVAGFMATCLIGLRSGVIVPKKADWLPMYRAYVNDQWTDFLSRLYHFAKEVWQYRIPQVQADRQELQALCRQMLAFENDYLLEYVDFLRSEACLDDPVRRAFGREKLADLGISE